MNQLLTTASHCKADNPDKQTASREELTGTVKDSLLGADAAGLLTKFLPSLA
ncbi:MAG TPA: hypothetical protein VLE50_01865 [Cellvibrio sp.]|nr:hypothetical protein [Cellvibrio sp.]